MSGPKLPPLSTGPSPGRIDRLAQDSQPWFESRPRPPAGSPDVLFVIFDDVGYSDFGCFGGEIATPSIDRLAAAGLRYTQFHTTTLCSPTRACLLTGRNHHSVGMRFLSNYDMGWPSGRGAVSPKAATVAEVLREAGWGTFAVGKWHLAPTDESSAAGPFDHWPLARGFDRFYGFMNGGTDQFHPELVEDNHVVEGDRIDRPGYHLSIDLADRAIGMLANQFSLRPDKPFFMNLAFGAGHWPHQAPEADLQACRGAFDAGWDVLRERRLQRQKAMGLVPPDTELPPANPGVRAWIDLTADERRLATRQQEAYAAALTLADRQLGRVLDFLDAAGRLDNALVVLLSDNGASTDCEPDGATNILRWFNGLPEPLAQRLASIEDIGGPRSASNYGWGWAQLSNTPTRLYKGHTHGGGVRDPLVVTWPRRIAEAGALRRQFVHAIDIVPTVLDLCGLRAPEVHRGVPQLPLHGTSFVASLDDAAADTGKHVQYFEMYGHRGLWHRGWKAVTCHRPGTPFDEDRWELYHLDRDFAEVHDLAPTHPAKLRELIERWWLEAGRYDALPLDDRRDLLFRPQPRPGSIRAQRHFVLWPGIAPVPAEAAPLLVDVSHQIVVELDWEPGDEGMLLGFGNVLGGWGLYVHGRQVHHVDSRCGEVLPLEAPTALTPGPHRVRFRFDRTGELQGIASLAVDDQPPVRQPRSGLLRRPTLATLTVGHAGLPSLVPGRDDAFAYTGRIRRVLVDIDDDRGTLAPPPDVD